MKRLMVAAALAPLSFAAMAFGGRAQADTTVSTATTTALSTSTAGNITLSGNGSIKPTAGPAAITVDSNASVTTGNTTTISYNGVGNATAPATGILINGGVTGNVNNDGAITVNENTSGDSTNQGIVTGPFANGSNRFGIQVTGPGVFTGSIANKGVITIVGENSAGISISSHMIGDLNQTGVINVKGGTPTYAGNVVSNAGNITYGVHAVGVIGGNAVISGVINATGQNAVGAALGDVGKAVKIGGTVTVTGFRSTAAPTDPKVLANLTGDQLLQGGPAVEIGGNVVQGVTVVAPVAASGNVTAVLPGVLTVYGSAPAMLIGGANSVTLGANAAGFSLDVGGSVSANGDYRNFSAMGIQIGGTNPLPVSAGGAPSQTGFAPVILTHGISVSGTITAQANGDTSGKSDATALLIGNGASVTSGGTGAALIVTGTIAAQGNSSALIASGGNATVEASVIDPTKAVPITVSGIKVAAGGSLTSISNSGTISAIIGGIPATLTTAAAGGTQGQAVAINDASGSVVSVINTNTIAAGLAPAISGTAIGANHSGVVAMYLGNTLGNVSVLQSANGNTSITPRITGAVILGNSTQAGTGTITGNESVEIAAGTLNGAIVFNGAGNNTLIVNGNATTVTTALSQAADGSLSINVLNGNLTMVSPPSAKYGGNATTINSNSFNIGAGGKVIFALDPSAVGAGTTPQFNVLGNATIANGAGIGVSLLSKLTSTETFTLIHAGSLTAGNISGNFTGALPFFYQGDITHTATDLNISISLKTAKQLGFNAAQAAALAAIYSQIGTDQKVENVVLNQTDRQGLLRIYNQFLPDYAGGPFDSLVTGQRALARAEADAPVKMLTDQTRGWVQEIGYLANRASDTTVNGYQAKGFGIAGGVEHARGDSAVGLSAAFMTTSVDNATQTNEGALSTVAFEGGVYWRKSGEGLNMNASVNAGYVSLGSHRLLLDQTSAGTVTLLRDAESEWSGLLGSAQFGVSYQFTAGRLYMRPELSADYIALYETAHRERGGGTALNLGINSRFNSEASVQTTLVFGYTFGDALRWRPEMTIGYRQIVYGGPASTTARFLSGGSAFTLSPQIGDRGGLLGRLGIRASGPYADISADAGGEFRNGYQTYDARAVARFLF
jgi:hypothetical protein